MSIEAIAWVLNDAPIPEKTPAGTPHPSSLTIVLLGLANHAARDGSDAYPAVPTLAKYARLSDRQVQRCLQALVEYGLIKPGDQRIVEAKIADPTKRPVVYDLVMEAQVSRGDSVSPRKPESKKPQVSRGDTVSPGDKSDTSGVTGATKRGDSHVTQTVLEPSNEPEGLREVSTSLAEPSPATPSLDPPPAPASPPADEGPSPFCERHPEGTDQRCRGCGLAYRERQRWESERERAAKARLSVDARARAEAKRLEIEACDLCDEDGYRGAKWCNHVPDQDRINAEGHAKARAALEEKRRKKREAAEAAAAEAAERAKARERARSELSVGDPTPAGV